jgi:subtilisin family serine protease
MIRMKKLNNMLITRNLLIIILFLFLASCGGGGGGDDGGPPMPSINISAKPISALLNNRSTISWSSSNATSCSAPSRWTSQTASGSNLLATSGSETVIITNEGNNVFSITCTGAGGNRSASVTVEGYRDINGVVVDGYILGAEVFIDEDGNWTREGNENSTTSDNYGKFNVRFSPGIRYLVSIGGTDLDSLTLLDNLLLTQKLNSYKRFAAITPLTSIAAFMEDPSLVNAALGIDASINVFNFDPVANKGDGGINDYLYEKGNQLTALAFSLQNITNHLNASSETTQDFFRAITEEIEKEYTETNTKVDIETQAFITKTLDNVFSKKSVTIDASDKVNTAISLASVLPVIEVKSFENLTTSVIRFALSTLQTDIQAIANGTATAEKVTSYSEDILTYIAEDQFIDANEIAPNISAIADSALTAEDTKVEINVSANDSYLTSAPVSVTVGNSSNGTTSLSGNTVTYDPNADYNGTDTFSYTITQGDKTSSADVIVTIEAVNDAPIATAASYTMDLKPQSQTSGSFTLAGTDIDGDALSYSIVSNGSYGTASLSGTTVTYQTHVSTQSAETESFTFKVNDGSLDSSVATISISLKTDPLYQYQWHLNNTGQTNFATTAGISGQDLNVDTVISTGYTGKGVTVAVLDSGLEIAHEDLVENIISGSYDFLNNDTDPTNPDSNGDHGTSVAGLIAAKGWNDLGGRGVAPNASLIGYNLLKNDSLSNQLQAWGTNPPISVDVDIYNMSYGVGYNDGETTYDLSNYLPDSYVAGLTNGLTLRNDKGAIYIKSSGNFFSTNATSDCGVNLTCTDMMIDNYSGQPYIMHVGALQANGGVSSYTSPGSALWISGFGGESGNNTSHTGVNNSTLNKPAMMTTDQSTCSKGYTQTGVSAGSGRNYNVFNNGDHAENSSCNYASTFNGTSAGAPTVAGVVALMLEANPDLTWRDVKHIIATTADQVGTDSDFTYELRGVKQYEWETNSAGYKFHNWFGFGKINAAEAVTTAESYTANSRGTFSSAFNSSGVINVAIDDNGANAPTTLNITKPSGSNDFVEFITLGIRFSHAVPKSIGIRLISPDGTIINVMTPMTNIGTNPSSTIFEIGVAGLYGESIEGTWSLLLNDYIVDDVAGALTYWDIRVYGN